jgi:membrane protease YdiL (CAAX protease family)
MKILFYGSLTWITPSLVCVYILSLLWAPYTKAYFQLKRLAYVTGVAAGTLSLLSFRLWHAELSDVLIAIPLGYISVFLSLVLASYSVSRAWDTLPHCFSVQAIVTSWCFVPFIIVASLIEEAIWRVGVQTYTTRLTGNSAIGIAITTFLFHRTHIVANRKVRIPKFLDLCFLSFGLGIVYSFTGNIVTVLLVHFIHNIHLFCARSSIDKRYRHAMAITADNVVSQFRNIIPRHFRTKEHMLARSQCVRTSVGE